jgi:phosphohistidine phosphatase
MDLYLVRHAIAEERSSERWIDDRERPLTLQGNKRFKRVARRLREPLAAVDHVFSSPLLRAWQTAEVLCGVAGWPPPEKMPELEPGTNPRQMVKALKPHAAGSGAMVIVGHEPDFGGLVSYLLVGDPEAHLVTLTKGGILRLSVDPSLRAGSAEIVWLLTPGIVLELAG